MEGLYKACVNYSVGNPQAYQNLEIFPINAKKGGKQSDLDYIVLGEGLQQGKVHIQETGNVNQLWLSNNSEKDLLIIKGEYVVGGKQNRMITVNGLVAAHTGRMYIPVHCVQHGRWNMEKDFGLGKFAVSAQLRGSVMKSASGSGGQHQTWGGVRCLLSLGEVHSGSEDFNEMYRSKEADINAYLRGFKKEKGQIGAVAVVQYNSGPQFFIDMFDQAGTFSKHYERLLASYALDAVVQRGGNANVSKSDAERFLEAALKMQTSESPSISLGTDHEINGNGAQGSALVHEETMVYLGARNNIERRDIAPDLPRRTPPFRTPSPFRTGGFERHGGCFGPFEDSFGDPLPPRRGKIR